MLEIFNEDFHGCVEPVLTFEEACDHPQIQSRNMIVDVPKPNGTTQRQIGTALKFDGVEPSYKFVGAKMGAHTEEILSQYGYTSEQIEELTEKVALK